MTKRIGHLKEAAVYKVKNLPDQKITVIQRLMTQNELHTTLRTTDFRSL